MEKIDNVLEVILSEIDSKNLWHHIYNKMTSNAKRQLLGELLNTYIGPIDASNSIFVDSRVKKQKCNDVLNFLEFVHGTGRTNKICRCIKYYLEDDSSGQCYLICPHRNIFNTYIEVLQNMGVKRLNCIKFIPITAIANFDLYEECRKNIFIAHECYEYIIKDLCN